MDNDKVWQFLRHSVNKNVLRLRLKIECLAVLQISAGSWFQACGPAVKEALELNTVCDHGTSKKPS